MITITALDRWQAVAWGRGYLQASREVPGPSMPQPALGQLAACEGWLEAEKSPEAVRQVALNLEDLARLFAEAWQQGYSFRFRQEAVRQARMPPEAAETG